MSPVSARFFALSFVFCLFCGAASARDKAFGPYQITQVAEDLHFPWSMAFLPDDSLLVSERSGQLRKISKGKVSEPISGVPEVFFKGQGGLMDVVLHPNFSDNSWVYLSYAAGNFDANALTVMRAKLLGNALSEQQVIFSVKPTKSTPVHYAGRMTFLPDNTLLITSGDGFDYREDAQRLNNLMGKTIRINSDGSVPANNPFVIENPNAQQNYVFSYGHRNHQGLIYDAKRQVIFSHEHGPAGGDELNILQAGVNYGWPVITYGRDYIGARISPFTEYPKMQQPLVDWTPSIAPSGMAVHQGKLFSQLNGDLLVSELKFKQVRWLQMDGLKVVGQSPLFAELQQRMRDVRVHPDGSIYLLTDSEAGKVYSVTPK